uniref:ULP_PROTEASE domain-containing protein n=1 Tax=Ascaris lumbricoides TaxID=6252 RepID=A0A0M3IJS8_ASCLU
LLGVKCSSYYRSHSSAPLIILNSIAIFEGFTIDVNVLRTDRLSVVCQPDGLWKDPSSERVIENIERLDCLPEVYLLFGMHICGVKRAGMHEYMPTLWDAYLRNEALQIRVITSRMYA